MQNWESNFYTTDESVDCKTLVQASGIILVIMSNTIPPLLCSTPPPIDFDDGGGSNENDDFEAFESADGEYGQFDGPSESNTPQHSLDKFHKELEIPIPSFSPFPINTPIDIAKQEKAENITDDPGGSKLKEKDDNPNPSIPKSDSASQPYESNIQQNYKANSSKDPIEFIMNEPPPIDIGYSSESQSPKNSRGDSPLSLEFSPGNLSDDDDSIEFQIVNESRYDDNTSLPSLKFDAINISKSATPIPEDKPKVTKSPVFDEMPPFDKDDHSNISAFESKESITLTEESSEFGQGGDCKRDCNEEQRHCRGESKGSIENFPNPKPPEDNTSKAEVATSEDRITDAINSSAQREESTSVIALNPNDNIGSHSEPDPEGKYCELLPSNDITNDISTLERNKTVELKPAEVSRTETSAKSNREETVFEADFSQAHLPPLESNFASYTKETDIPRTDTLETNDEQNDFDDDFEEFQDFTTAKDTKIESGKQNIEEKIVVAEEDDDFGDFNDFQESGGTSGAVPQTPPINPEKINDKLKNVLEAMFPVSDILSANLGGDSSTFPKISDNDLTTNLREIDSAKALEYQWLRSNVKNSLVKSLGIDSRNILYGEKWNNSMPRFAANLGFGPLEPLKPTKFTPDTSSSRNSKATSSGSSEKPSMSTNDVPAVKFDWNSSGLVNPLDGVKEILHEGKTETIYPTKPNNTNEPSHITPPEKNTTTIEQTTTDCNSCLSDVNNDLKNLEDIADRVMIATNKESLKSDEDFTKSPPTLLTTSKLIPLKETHIFTPSKSEGTISRSVNKSNDKGPIDFDYEIAAAGIVINEQVVKKEYRDIVYNPDAQTKDSLEGFSAEISQGNNGVDQNVPVVDPNKCSRQKLSGPDLLSGPILNILEKKADPITEAKCDLADEFTDFQQSISVSEKQQPPTFLPAQGIIETNSRVPEKDSTANEKHVKATFDDEFSDFQSMPPPEPSQLKSMSEKPKSRTQTPILNDEMILSPAVLLPQAIQLKSSEPKINWPSDSEINPEELARLEQLFPQAKQVTAQTVVLNKTSDVASANSSPKKEQKDEDDWSDFVSVQPDVNSANVRLQNPSTQTSIPLSTISKTYDDDDWSDFVSGTPASTANSSNYPQINRQQWNSTQLPPPQFMAWNQPSVYNNLPPLTSQGGFSSAQPATSHMNFQPQFNNPTTVPTMSAKNVYQPNIHNSNTNFLMNGHLNHTGVSQLPQQHQQHDLKFSQQNHLQYQGQPSFSNQQQIRQPPLQQQHISPNLNTNINVLRSQLNMAPSISLLPDLSFAAPKSLVNLTRTNASNKK